MKKLIIILFLTLSINTYAQTEYYTNDGKSIMSELEITQVMNGIKEKMTKAMNQEMFVSLTIEYTEQKKDSIIHKVNFKINDKKSLEKFNMGPLAELKDKEFPEFKLKTLFGENFDSKILKGKPTLINFWFTKCAPCIDEMPILNKLAEKYKNEYNFIAITYENKENVDEFLKKHPFNFKHIINAKEFTDKLSITAYPINLFLDKNNVLKYIENGIPYVKNENGELKMGGGNEIIEILEKLK